MHKDGKWARQIIEWQDEEGKWGDYHSLAVAGNSHITTEQAVRRLERLGYTMEDECIRKAVQYMSDCLVGKKTIPDRVEKVHDWNVFLALILSTGIRRFTEDNLRANEVAAQWAQIVTTAFEDGGYNHDKYVDAYKQILKPNGGRINGLETYYPVSLLCDCLDEKTENAFVEYILNFDKGIYYVYGSKLIVLPQEFQSKNASYYLGAMELLVRYKHTRHKLKFVADWLMENRNENGKWDMGQVVNDKLYFPLSDDWRKKENREADCTERIEKLLNTLQSC
ncbi:MAG: hypothetical protein IJN16_10915 [Lachnospiraceae bacterium]|nr:hypothetical protein [Lachnospiraceae bacterium]